MFKQTPTNDCIMQGFTRELFIKELIETQRKLGIAEYERDEAIIDLQKTLDVIAEDSPEAWQKIGERYGIV